MSQNIVHDVWDVDTNSLKKARAIPHKSRKASMLCGFSFFGLLRHDKPLFYWDMGKIYFIGLWVIFILLGYG